MDDDATKSTPSLDWTVSRAQCEREALHLVIAWSRDEPHRVGEVAPIEARCVLGRGGPPAGDPSPRVVFSQMRPGVRFDGTPLAGKTLSRSQLELTPLPDGTLEVHSVGRCDLMLHDQVVKHQLARPGDTLVLNAALVLLVERRPCGLPALRAFRGEPPYLSFDFGDADPHGIVGESPAAWTLREQLASAAATRQHVLVLGESGVGKELAARAIHEMSGPDDRPYVARNASTFPDTLIDAELFGSARGFPNVGSPERPGLLGEANGGTLFLDEIGELSPHLQAHLLRVLDRGGEYQRLGDPRARTASVRVIAATNRSPDKLKYDFCARFTIRVEVPGLEQRRADIPLLIRHLLAAAAAADPAVAERFFKPRVGKIHEARVDPRLIDRLLRHPFTTHTRELELLLSLALSSSPGPLVALTPEVIAALRSAKPAPERATGPGALGKDEIVAALATTNGNVTDAALLLGLSSRFVLYRLMDRFEIKRD